MQIAANMRVIIHTVTVLFMVSLFCVVEPRSIMVMAVSLAV